MPACLGLMESASAFCPEAKWQRCIVHFYRNVFTIVPRGQVNHVARMLKAIHASKDKAATREKAETVVKKLKGRKLHQAAEIVKNGIADTLISGCPLVAHPARQSSSAHPARGAMP